MSDERVDADEVVKKTAQDTGALKVHEEVAIVSEAKWDEAVERIAARDRGLLDRLAR